MSKIFTESIENVNFPDDLRLAEKQLFALVRKEYYLKTECL